MSKVSVSFPKLLWEQVMGILGAISIEIWRRRAIYRGQKMRDLRKKVRKLQARAQKFEEAATNLQEENSLLKKSLEMLH